MYGGSARLIRLTPSRELAKHNGKPIPMLDSDPLLKVRKPGTLLGSSRRFARHGQAGNEISDLYPHLAGCVDCMAVIRSMYADSFAHGSGLLQMNTGFLGQGYPSLGSWVTYGLGTVNQNLPGYVVLLDHRGGPISGPPNWGSGFMPATYQGTQFRTSGEPILNLQPPKGITAAQQRNQLDLLAELSLPRRERQYGQLGAQGSNRQLRAGLPDAGECPRGCRSLERIGRNAATLRARRSADRAVRPALPAGAEAGRARRQVCAGLLGRRPQRREEQIPQLKVRYSAETEQQLKEKLAAAAVHSTICEVIPTRFSGTGIPSGSVERQAEDRIARKNSSITTII